MCDPSCHRLFPQCEPTASGVCLAPGDLELELSGQQERRSRGIKSWRIGPAVCIYVSVTHWHSAALSSQLDSTDRRAVKARGRHEILSSFFRLHSVFLSICVSQTHSVECEGMDRRRPANSPQGNAHCEHGRHTVQFLYLNQVTSNTNCQEPLVALIFYPW